MWGLFTPRCICECMVFYGPIVPEIKTILLYSARNTFVKTILSLMNSIR